MKYRIKSKNKQPKHFTLAVKEKIVSYYRSGLFTAEALCKKHEISVNLLNEWMREYAYLQVQRQRVQPMYQPKYRSKDEEIAALKAELAAQEKELKYAKLKGEALEILIQIAEDKFGIPIKKKVGRRR